MPWWFPLLIRYGLPLLLKTGILTHAEAMAVRIWYDTKRFAENVKTYHEPEDFPNPPPEIRTPNNIKRG